VQCPDLEQARLGRAVVAGLVALLLVAAAQNALSPPPVSTDAHLAVGPGRLEAAHQLVDRAAAERVEALGRAIVIQARPRST
jgi:hypothetical protein